MTENHWRIPLAIGQPPSPRYRHTAVIYKHHIYIFGGYYQTYQQPRTRYNDLFKYNLFTKKWSRIHYKNTVPIHRSGHSAIVYKDALYVFGGFTDAVYSVTKSLERFDFLKESWRSLPKSAYAHGFHTAVQYKDAMIVFGGCTYLRNGLPQLEKFLLEDEIWEPVQASGVYPSRRGGHSAFVYEGKMFVFGGKELTRSRFNDVWSLDLETYRWTCVSVGGSNPTLFPDPRACSSVVLHRDAFYIFGGLNAALETLNDFWKFDLKSNRWSKVSYRGSAPSPRRYSAVVKQGRVLWMFGGSDGERYFNDFYEFEFAADPSEMNWIRVLERKGFYDIIFE